MKILVLFGGARRVNTYKVLQTVKDAMQLEKPVEFKEIWLDNMELPFCCSCYSCFFHGEEKCPHVSAVKPVFQEMIQSDALIMATPVYSMQLSAVLKNFMDHLSYVIHRPAFPSKKALVITTTAGGGHVGTANYLKSILHLWGFDRVYTIPVRVAAMELTINKKLKKKICKISQAFFEDIVQGRLYPPSMKYLFYFSIWKAMNGQGEKDQTPDYIYWQERGWLAKDYFHPISLPRRIMGRSMWKFFTYFLRM